MIWLFYSTLLACQTAIIHDHHSRPLRSLLGAPRRRRDARSGVGVRGLLPRRGGGLEQRFTHSRPSTSTRRPRSVRPDPLVELLDGRVQDCYLCPNWSLGGAKQWSSNATTIITVMKMAYINPGYQSMYAQPLCGHVHRTDLFHESTWAPSSRHLRVGLPPGPPLPGEALAAPVPRHPLRRARRRDHRPLRARRRGARAPRRPGAHRCGPGRVRKAVMGASPLAPSLRRRQAPPPRPRGSRRCQAGRPCSPPAVAARGPQPSPLAPRSPPATAALAPPARDAGEAQPLDAGAARESSMQQGGGPI